MSVFHNNVLSGAAGSGGAAAAFTLEKSVRFNNGDSPYLNRTPSSAGNRTTWTWSCWMKRGDLSASTFRFFSVIKARNDNDTTALMIDHEGRLKIGGYNNIFRTSEAQFRDPAAWMNIVVVADLGQSSAADRFKAWVNGVSIDWTNTTVTPTSTGINSDAKHNIGAEQDTSGSPYNYFDGYLTDIYFIDGSALDPTSFGAFDDNGVWQAAAYSGTFGTNGFHLFDFANESTVGHDSSGNENDFTANNISTSAGAGNDVLFDVPTNGDSSDDTGAGGEVSGNYATLNLLLKASTTTLSNGNLDYTNSVRNLVRSTIAIPQSGKWYFEATVTGETTGGDHGAGLIVTSNTTLAVGYVGQVTGSYGYYGDGNKYANGAAGASYGSSFGPGDTIGIAFDADGGNLYFYKNGVAQNSGTAAFTGLTDQYFFAIENGPNGSMTANFGQRAFAYTAPSGYKALCTTNLPTPTIADGSDYFEAKLYTTETTISGLSFSPDFVWLKRRSQSADNGLYDTVRGVSKILYTNSANAEETTAGVSAFNSDGFDLGTNALFKGGGHSFVSWNWDAGSSTVSNTDGTITSSVRANQTAGFSIVAYTGTGSNATVGHGLNAVPELIILKDRDAAKNWAVWHKDLSSNAHYLILNSTDAQANTFPYWNGDHTSSVFTLGTTGGSNESGDDFIAYCFAPVAGYSAFGTYTGSSDGEFVYTGFRPALVAVRRYDSSGTWVVCDSARDPDNAVVPFLSWNSNAAEVNSADRFDFLSNGFKLRAPSNFNPNESGGDYLYIAIAENPFQANGGLAR